MRATLWSSPVDTWVTPVSAATRTGIECSVVLPSPSCPYTLPPQAQTVPSELAATECCPPAARLPATTAPLTLYVAVVTPLVVAPLFSASAFSV